MSVSHHSAPDLTHKEIRRYSRHLIVPSIGVDGQRKLKAASVLVVGLGGLGSPVAMYLAAAGVGRIGLVDGDTVSESNLQRQVIHTTEDIGRPKVESASETILGINPHVQVDTHSLPLTSENALNILRPYDVIADATDNFPTRYLLNDSCVILGKPDVYGSVFRFEGQASVFDAQAGPCYRCLFPHPPSPGTVPTCADGGILGILPGTIGAIQATETIKLILGLGDTLIGTLLLYDALSMRFDRVTVKKNPKCPVCSQAPAEVALVDYEQFCNMPGHEQSTFRSQLEIPVPTLTAREVKAKLDAGEDLLLLDVREPHEWQISDIASATHHIPAGQILDRLDTLDQEREIVVYCRSGRRSSEVVQMLRERGYSRSKNMEGGINAWSQEIDPYLPVY